MTDEKKPNGFIEALLIYAYTDKHGSNYFQLLDPAQNDGRSVIELVLKQVQYNEKLFKSSYTGGMYKAEIQEKKVSYNTKTTATDYWKCKEDIVRWRALQSAADEEGKLVKTLKENKMIEVLQPIKDAYAIADYSQRRLILAEVIRIVTSGRK